MVRRPGNGDSGANPGPSIDVPTFVTRRSGGVTGWWRRLGRQGRPIQRDSQLPQRLAEIRLAELGDGRWWSTATVAQLPTVVAARALISDTAAMLPVFAVRDGQPVDPTPTVLMRPDPSPGMTRRRWVHRAAMSLTGWGNVYAGLTRIGSNDWPLSAEILNPDLVAPVYDPADPWRIVGWTYATWQLAPGDVVHVPLWESRLEPIARPPLLEAQAAFDDLAILWGFATSYWRDGGKPPYALKYPSRLSSEQATEALEQWVTARNLYRPGVLTGGWELLDFSMPTAADALLLDGLAYIDQQIARIFGIPPTLLNVRAETGSLTYSNAQDEVIRWLSLSLYPTWLARLEDVFTQMLPRGQQAMFDTTSLTFGLGLSRPGLDEARPATAPAPTAPAPAAEAVTGA
jgi:HK97 family phage portal protein